MVDVSKFIGAPKKEVLLITYSDVFQLETEVNKFGEEYKNQSAVAIIDARDLKELGTSENKNVEISNKHGSVVVKAKKSDDNHTGLIFMPNSFYSNLLMSANTMNSDTGVFDCKKVKVEVSKSSKTISDVKDFLPLSD